MTAALLLMAPLGHGDGVDAVTAAAETPPLYDDDAGGHANGDDPAIWVHPAKPGKSVVIATAKEGGLYAYSLTGALLQHVAAEPPPGDGHEPGRLNNVDLVHGFRLSTGATVDLAVASDRGRDHLRVYAIDPAKAAAGQAPLTDVTDPAVPFVFNSAQEEVDEAETAYGLAVSGTQVLVSRRHRTTVGLLQLAAAPGGTVTYRRLRTLDLPATFPLPDGTTWVPCGEPGELPQVEGMVVDRARGLLYAAQEDVGIWRMPADLSGRPVLIDKVREYGRQDTYDPQTEECTPGQDRGFGGEHLSADAEGLTIYEDGDGGYLLASSQGDDTFSVYDRRTNRHLGRFRMAPGPHADGSEVSDGAMVTSASLGGAFPKGLLVVHDGTDAPADGDREITNFKFVDWRKVEHTLR
ncbi:phytase [Nonomuraea terrae]|uniref:Phytase n=1 Tax=Nonomuraea terrae TaxID=2530383 RepID=A0A4R4YQ19_9ACTN|nr:phytase [Nonomuraea terrae]TDD46680.1 phytase [Nonomuraea terrae]